MVRAAEAAGEPAGHGLEAAAEAMSLKKASKLGAAADGWGAGAGTAAAAAAAAASAGTEDPKLVSKSARKILVKRLKTTNFPSLLFICSNDAEMFKWSLTMHDVKGHLNNCWLPAVKLDENPLSLKEDPLLFVAVAATDAAAAAAVGVRSPALVDTGLGAWANRSPAVGLDSAKKQNFVHI